MGTSALDLLNALDTQLEHLETTRLIGGARARVHKEWSAMALAGLRLLSACPSHPASDVDKRLELLLGSMAAPPGSRPLSSPGTGLLGISTTIGILADLRRTQPLLSAETRALTDDALRSNTQAALARAARWTRHNLLAINVTPGRQLVRLAGFDAEPNRPLALHVWRTTGPSDADIDGAVARWAIAATASVSSRFTVTQHALQLASADIALLCASATAIIERASQVAIVNDTDATQAISALTAAGRQWRRTATWPDHLRLGGRSTELRNASADLRQALTETFRSGRDWRPARELFADSTPEQHLAIACSSLQAASRVGHEVAASFQQLTHGQTRV